MARSCPTSIALNRGQNRHASEMGAVILGAGAFGMLFNGWHLIEVEGRAAEQREGLKTLPCKSWRDGDIWVFCRFGCRILQTYRYVSQSNFLLRFATGARHDSWNLDSTRAAGISLAFADLFHDGHRAGAACERLREAIRSDCPGGNNFVGANSDFRYGWRHDYRYACSRICAHTLRIRHCEPGFERPETFD